MRAVTQIRTGTEAKDKSGQTHKRAQNHACPGRNPGRDQVGGVSVREARAHPRGERRARPVGQA